MKLLFSTHAWEDYLYWQQQDRKVLMRIIRLIRDIQRSPFEGIGKPEALRHSLAGYWSRRITGEQRNVYKIENDKLFIAQLRYHY